MFIVPFIRNFWTFWCFSTIKSKTIRKKQVTLKKNNNIVHTYNTFIDLYHKNKLPFINKYLLTTPNLLYKLNSKTNVMQIRYNFIRISVICSLSLFSYVTLANVVTTDQSHPAHSFRAKKRIIKLPAAAAVLVRPTSDVKELDIEISPNEIQIVPEDSLAPLVAKGKVAMQQRKDSVMKAKAQMGTATTEPELAVPYIPPVEVRPAPAAVSAAQEVATEPELLTTKGNNAPTENSATPKIEKTNDPQHAEPELTIANPNATTSPTTITEKATENSGQTQDAHHAEPELKLDNTDANKEVSKTDFIAKGGSSTVTPYTQAPMKGIPWMVFDNNRESVDFGNVRLGERPSHTFVFTNYGDTDLEIELVSACECTIIEHSKEKIAPGASGFLKATFNSSAVYPEGVNRLNEKEITIILKNTYPTNGYPIVKTVSFKAFVQ